MRTADYGFAKGVPWWGTAVRSYGPAGAAVAASSSDGVLDAVVGNVPWITHIEGI